MAAPSSPPQDLNDLDTLTRLAIELRTARGRISPPWPIWAKSWSDLIAGTTGVQVWFFDSTPAHSLFFVFLFSFIVMRGRSWEVERKMEERLERLDESLTLLSEEIAKRQRVTEKQVDSLRPATSS